MNPQLLPDGCFICYRIWGGSVFPQPRQPRPRFPGSSPPGYPQLCFPRGLSSGVPPPTCLGLDLCSGGLRSGPGTEVRGGSPSVVHPRGPLSELHWPPPHHACLFGHNLSTGHVHSADLSIALRKARTTAPDFLWSPHLSPSLHSPAHAVPCGRPSIPCLPLRSSVPRRGGASASLLPAGRPPACPQRCSLWPRRDAQTSSSLLPNRHKLCPELAP